MTTWKWTHPPEQEAKAGNAKTTPREKGTELPLPLRLAVSSPRQNTLAMGREAVLNENDMGGEIFDGTTTDEWRRRRMTAGHGRRTPCWIAYFSPGCRQDTSQHNPRAVPRLVRIFVASRARNSLHRRVGANRTADLLLELSVTKKRESPMCVGPWQMSNRFAEALLPDASGIKHRFVTFGSLSLLQCHPPFVTLDLC